MASILKVDELQGIATAGDITVTSEGGAATQSLQQGLAKAWARLSSTAVTKSLNTSGFTDNGTGDYTITFTSAFTDGVFAGKASTVGPTSRVAVYSNSQTTGIDVDAFTTTTGSRVDSGTALSIHGDLA